jgi:hypothetical protein
MIGTTEVIVSGLMILSPDVTQMPLLAKQAPNLANVFVSTKIQQHYKYKSKAY